MSNCSNHPDRPAIEACEVCKKSVCAECLWYAESGERLCPQDAQSWIAEGRQVLPPEQFDSAIAYSQSDSKAQITPKAKGKYSANDQDMMALVACLMGSLLIGSCFGGSCFFPVLAIILGAIAISQRKQAVDEQRTLVLASIGIAGGGLIFFFSFAYILAVFGMMLYGILSN